MCDESSAFGNARLSGNVQMSEYSCISGYAQAKDNAKLKDDCYVGGNVKLQVTVIYLAPHNCMIMYRYVKKGR